MCQKQQEAKRRVERSTLEHFSGISSHHVQTNHLFFLTNCDLTVSGRHDSPQSQYHFHVCHVLALRLKGTIVRVGELSSKDLDLVIT